MKKLILLLTFAALLFSFAPSAQAAVPVDLTSWNEVTLTLGGQPAGNWVLSNGNTTVTQTVNADPSFFLNGLNQTNYTINGSWSVQTRSDDDFMGFVFGLQDNSHFYLMDWKQNSQFYAGTTAQEGLSIKRISAPSVGDLTLADFWSSAGTAHTTVLDTHYSSSLGWDDLTEYNFQLDFAPGTFDVIVKEGNTEIWNTTVNDNTYTAGQFGFYNFSQENVQYSGFEQEGGEIVTTGVVPEPASMALVGMGLMGMPLFRRKRSA